MLHKIHKTDEGRTEAQKELSKDAWKDRRSCLRVKLEAK